MERKIEPQGFVNTRTASYILCLSESTLKRHRGKGTGPNFYKFGSSIRYSVIDLKRYIRKSRNITD